MKKFRIETTGANTIEVFAPYNERFVKRLKNFGDRKWNDEKKCWVIPADSISEVRQLMLEVFGENDLYSDSYASVKLSFSDDYTNRTTSIEMYSRIIASAKSRDIAGPISSGVIYTSGEYCTGGSSKHPTVTIKGGSEIVIKNVPIQLARTEVVPEIIQVKIDDGSIDKEALILERNRLQNRINEINQLLKED